MRSRYVRLLVVTLAVLGAIALPVQAQDCSGISPIYPTDPDLLGELTTVRYVNGLVNPVDAKSPPGDLERLFVLEKPGRVRVIKNDVLLPTPFVDIDPLVGITFNEEGLLGLAFHPDYVTNRWLFLYYTNNSGNIVVARYTADAFDPDVSDGAAGQIVLTVPHTVAPNHNGGAMAFGPDGYLYIGVGDGGSSCDPGPGTLGNAQSLNTNLGKILRLNVDSLPYGTAGNPFDGGTPGNDEIWAYGVRNPWRLSFDRATGNLYIGDVGQNAWEEIDCSEAGTSGENFGWVNYEGSLCSPHPSGCSSSGGCGGIANHAAPIATYSLAGSPCAVTGGYVYRGCRMPQLHGTYFFADYCSDFIRTFRTDSSCSAGPVFTRTTDLTPNIGGIDSISSFAEDARGEIYLLDHNGGELFKLLPDLSIMETSGPGAPPMYFDADMVWEDLEASSLQPIDAYRVYRVRNNPTGTYECVQRVDAQANCAGGECRWTGGDPGVPNQGKVYFYLIAAENTAGTQSTVGTDSAGTLRTVNTGALCPL